jgi:hypothetical protein
MSVPCKRDFGPDRQRCQLHKAYAKQRGCGSQLEYPEPLGRRPPMAVAIPAEMIAIISTMHRPKWARAPGRLDNKDPVAGHAVPTGHSFTTSMPLLDPLTLTCGIAGSAIRSASSALRPSSSQHAQHGKTASTGKQACVLDRAGLVDVTAEQIFVSRSDEAATAALRAISMHVLHR